MSAFRLLAAGSSSVTRLGAKDGQPFRAEAPAAATEDLPGNAVRTSSLEHEWRKTAPCRNWPPAAPIKGSAGLPPPPPSSAAHLARRQASAPQPAARAGCPFPTSPLTALIASPPGKTSPLETTESSDSASRHLPCALRLAFHGSSSSSRRAGPLPRPAATLHLVRNHHASNQLKPSAAMGGSASDLAPSGLSGRNGGSAAAVGARLLRTNTKSAAEQAGPCVVPAGAWYGRCTALTAASVVASAAERLPATAKRQERLSAPQP
ncbi:serine/arginine repetitive matrix protein 2-like [Schistocerca piceifrons]|uniref:serine/arginine repetitive matrix protein 2-like n=1 Tax=Schistocerca piceifrons TaxID=274613 RepID=UPI001F5E92A3|nr:serine/arginine repetitive matrix protein 2-like [Schistocerca piceifrons]